MRLIALLAVLALAAAACTSGDAPGPTATPEAPAAPAPTPNDEAVGDEAVGDEAVGDKAVGDDTAGGEAAGGAASPTATPGTRPTPSPTAVSRPTPTAAPTPTPLPAPTAAPSPTATPPPPTATPAPPSTPVAPTATPTAVPTAAPTAAPAPAATPTPAHSPTPSPPTPTPTPTETPSPAPASPTPTPPPGPLANLRPAGFDGRSALNAHRTAGALTTGNLDVNEVAYVDWFIRNDGLVTVDQTFFTDLYVDDVFVERWNSTGLEPSVAVGVTDWVGISEFVQITPGAHRLRIVVDPTDIVLESDESDNTVERTFTWGGTAPVRPEFVKRPNLVAAPPTGRSAPLVASSSRSAPVSGGLSADAPTFISWAVRNAGLASIPGVVRFHLFLDGVFVDDQLADGLLASQRVEVQAWDGLPSTITVGPGPHTLRLVLDPGDLIEESDESDNVYEVELTWGSGEPTDVPEPIAPQADPPLPARDSSRPNLAPIIPFGWDGSVVAKSFNASGTASEGLDGLLSVLAPSYVSFVLWNASPVAANARFDVDVLVDGASVGEVGFLGDFDDSGGVWTGAVTLPAGSVAAGPHTVEVVLDSGGTVEEADEADNSFARGFEWLAEPLPDPDPPASYTREEVEALLAALPGLLLVTGDLGGDDATPEVWTQPVLDAGEAAYFLITGRRLRDERVTIEILPSEEYDARDLAHCISAHAALAAEEYPAVVDRCRETGRQSAGLTQEAGGRVLVWVREEQSPASVLNVLLHELGHALARLSNRDWADTPAGGAHEAFQEAQAQVFEAVAWRHIEEFMGASFRSYPDLSVLREEIEELIDGRIDGSIEGEPHDLGYLLAWLAVLRDRAAPGLGDELRTEGALDAASSLALYDYLVAMPVEAAVSLASSLLDGAGPFLDEFLGIVLSRTVRDLSQDDEGHPDLREVTFLAP